MDELAIGGLNEQEGIKGMYLTFLVGDEDYGLEIAFVTEIINVQAITQVPELPAYIKGIINLRGKIIPVLDVRIRFNKPPQEYNDRTCIIVVDVGGTVIGLIVDMVREVMSIDEEDIVPPAAQGARNRYVSGIGKTPSGIKLLLDVERLVSDENLE